MRLLSALTLLVLASAGRAHYHMLLPDKPSAKKGEPVTVTFQFGHPFEHQLSPMEAPRSVTLVAPDGKRIEVKGKLKKVSLKGEKGGVDGYRFTFTPEQRGDYVLTFTSAPTLTEDHERYADSVKVVIHVQAQKGWDRNVTGSGEWQPMTRPYGLLPGTVFQARFKRVGLEDGKTNPNISPLVEVERYNPAPPRQLPADEFITRTVKPDDRGVVTTTLPEAGWWCLTTTSAVVTAVVDEKVVKTTIRSTLWVHVDKSAPVRPAE